MSSFSLGADHKDIHVRDGSPYYWPGLNIFDHIPILQNSCCKVKIVINNNKNNSKDKVNDYLLLAFL